MEVVQSMGMNRASKARSMVFPMTRHRDRATERLSGQRWCASVRERRSPSRSKAWGWCFDEKRRGLDGEVPHTVVQGVRWMKTKALSRDQCKTWEGLSNEKQMRLGRPKGSTSESPEEIVIYMCIYIYIYICISVCVCCNML